MFPVKLHQQQLLINTQATLIIINGACPKKQQSMNSKLRFGLIVAATTLNLVWFVMGLVQKNYNSALGWLTAAVWSFGALFETENND
jgi:hypothetical protein